MRLRVKKNPFIYRTYHTWSHGGLQFCKEPEGEIGRQLIITMCLWRPPQSICDLIPPTETNAHKDKTTTPGTTSPTLYEQCVGSLTSHRVITNKGCETGPTVYRPYPRRLERLTICR